MRAIVGCRSGDLKCLLVRYRFRARGRRHLLLWRRSLWGDRSLATAVAARLALQVAFPAIATAATAVASPAAAFAMLGVVRRAGLSLRDGRLRRVGCTRFLRLLWLLRLPRFARRSLLLRFTRAVAARFTVAAWLLLPAALRRALLGLLARFATLAVALDVAAVLTATVARLALVAPLRPLGPVAPAAPALVARLPLGFPALWRRWRRHYLDRLALEPAHDVR